MASKKTPPKPAPATDGKYIENKVDTDGSPFLLQEERSVKKMVDKLTIAKKKGQPPLPPPENPIQLWKKKVIERLRATGHKPEADYLQKNWGDNNILSENDAFAKVWKQEAGLTKEYTYRYLWDGNPTGATTKSLGGALQGLLADACYQHRVSEMNRVRPDGAIGPGPEDNYAVWPKKGRLIKVEYGNPPSTHYMPSDDTNPAGKTNGELSYHAALSYGTKNIKSDAGALGPNPAYLTNDQWDFIGENNLRNDDKNGTIPNNPADFEAACKRRGLTFPPAKPTASAGGGPELLYGDLTVFHGPDERAIGYAAATSMHQGGGYMIEGSTTVFVGPQLLPVSRVGDATSDGMFAVSGADDFLVG
jgi:hypothetical protein